MVAVSLFRLVNRARLFVTLQLDRRTEQLHPQPISRPVRHNARAPPPRHRLHPEWDPGLQNGCAGAANAAGTDFHEPAAEPPPPEQQVSWRWHGAAGRCAAPQQPYRTATATS